MKEKDENATPAPVGNRLEPVGKPPSSPFVSFHYLYKLAADPTELCGTVLVRRSDGMLVERDLDQVQPDKLPLLWDRVKAGDVYVLWGYRHEPHAEIGPQWSLLGRPRHRHHLRRHSRPHMQRQPLPLDE